MATAKELLAAVGAKVKFTPSEAALIKACVLGKGQKTINQINADYSKAMGKPHKVESTKSNLSKIRSMFRASGYQFPASWEPKSTGPGGGRRVERMGIDEALNGLDLGDDFELEVFEGVEQADTATAE